MFRKLILLISLAALTASAYTITYRGTAGRGYMLVNGTATNNWVGRCQLRWVSTNINYVVTGISANDILSHRSNNWTVDINTDTMIAIFTKEAPPAPYKVVDGVNSIEVSCEEESWSKIVFAAPNSVAFINDGSSYLYPSKVDSVLIQAVDGNIECCTATNGYVTVKTKGDNALVPNAPTFIEEGQKIILNRQISRLFVRGTGKAIITGVSE